MERISSVTKRYQPAPLTPDALENIKQRSAENALKAVPETPEEAKSRRIEIVRAQSEVPPAYALATLADVRNATEGEKAAWRAAKEFVERDFRRPGVGLYGPVGPGKTHIVAAIANAAIMRERRAIMLTAAQLVLRLRATFSTQDESELALIQRLVRTPVLIIDDLGKEQITPSSAQALSEFFNERWNLGLAIVVTANLSAGELKRSKYSKPPDGIDPSYTTAVLDRIWGMTGDWIKVDGPSRRRAS